MQTHCPDCDVPLVRVDIPVDIREYAPENAATVGSCPRCLRTVAVDDDASELASATTRPAAIPDGDGGAALVLLLGQLDSLALNRAAIQSLLDYAESSGTDVFLAIDRLAADDAVDAYVDLARRRQQLESMLDY